MGVSKNSGTPKWMVKIMETPIKMDDLGVPLFSETSKLEPLGNKFVGQILREYPCINNPNKFSNFLVNKVFIEGTNGG